MTGDFDLVGISVFPREADAPLLIDADRVLPIAVSFECLEPVGRGHPEIVESFCIVQKAQFPKGHALDCRRQSAPQAAPDGGCLPIGETDDHNVV